MPIQQPFLPSPAHPEPCVSLIGMAGAGKSTVGEALAQELGWALVDSDHLIEALYGTRLQDITDALGKSAFLDVEAQVVTALRVHRAVIATGGSVVYRETAVRHLSSLGPVVFLDVPFPLIEERVALNPERGLAIAPGESLEALFQERQPLYRAAASLHCPAGTLDPQECARWILEHLPHDWRSSAATA